MSVPGSGGSTRGKWLALAAALLGWMFDGFEMGLFPLVARPAIKDLMRDEKSPALLGASSVGLMGQAFAANHLVAASSLVPGRTEVSDNLVGKWMGLATACFLVGAATGGVLFGWLGDRIGRVRAMTLSVLTYAIFSGLCGLAVNPEQIAVLRFVSALGMGGEWSLGVALVMEIWPDKSRGFLAGLIGAASNVGFLLIGVVGGWLMNSLPEAGNLLGAVGVSDAQVSWLTGNSGWRLIMFVGAVPALLTFFIRLFVPESERWQKEQDRGNTSNWAARDLLGVAVGALGVVAILYLWTVEFNLVIRVAGSLAALTVAALGYLYPVIRYLERSRRWGDLPAQFGTPIRRMLMGACLGGVALLGTWASMQWAPVWANQLSGSTAAMAQTQIWSALGAIFGTIAGALAGDKLGRRPTYFLLCVGSLASSLFFFQMNHSYGTMFLASVFVAGGMTASFYGWLPLYLPELFTSGMRATGQGFSFNFGRILAAVGALQTGFLMKQVFHEDYAKACSVMSLVYVVGMVIIWLAPETRGKPLPE